MARHEQVKKEIGRALEATEGVRVTFEPLVGGTARETTSG
jgi:hypothetical protein